MARDQAPVTDKELEALQEQMEGQRQAIREALAEDLNGDPDDYRANREAVPDGNHE